MEREPEGAPLKMPVAVRRVRGPPNQTAEPASVTRRVRPPPKQTAEPASAAR
ncbi:hypothetical protein KIN20_005027 [Parelaphostrongylus tenuis]|uniref:Uncharacterized protein n=1 Tax=Parelaphostrongylus tenuis TaxID=148309 RepID=A0AAD5LZP1_PARTN|nr:hypothetical protein KIN20_005027 [Parelaphostrongylus tenuis]